jgi:PilZ domain
MGIERRINPRVDVIHDFTIHHEFLERQSHKTRDLSISGVFVEGDFTSVGVGSTVDISFIMPSLLPGDGKVIEYTLKAIVARIMPDGAGLKFAEPDMETCNALLKLRDRIT